MKRNKFFALAGATSIAAALPLPIEARENPVKLIHGNIDFYGAERLEAEQAVLQIVDEVYSKYGKFSQIDKNVLTRLAYFNYGKYESQWIRTKNSDGGEDWNVRLKTYVRVHVGNSLKCYCRITIPHFYVRANDYTKEKPKFKWVPLG